ncbi:MULTISPECIES: YjcZ family sporulation protein [Bacillus cereus group]
MYRIGGSILAEEKGYGRGYGYGGYALLIVLFILLVIIGAVYFC